jgi:glycosyltransferase involved in cell wall biosynthesis
VLAAALDTLRAAGRPLTVVATGAGTTAFQGPDLLGLGYVTGRELTVLYDLAAGMVQTTLYEAGSFPLWEAMLASKPVACSAIPPLLEQLERQDTTAATFDPADSAAVAAALTRLVERPPDAAAIERNRRIVAERTFRDVAAGYLDVFRAVAGGDLR